ncbi:hypothetical protein Bpfe_014627, partial [Biomphalaria pfeifferi]
SVRDSSANNNRLSPVLIQQSTPGSALQQSAPGPHRVKQWCKPVLVRASSSVVAT